MNTTDQRPATGTADTRRLPAHVYDWQEWQDQYLRDHVATMTTHAMAKALGVHHSTTGRRLAKLGLRSQASRAEADEKRMAQLKSYNATRTYNPVWQPDQDATLTRIFRECREAGRPIDWKAISDQTGRTPHACRQRAVTLRLGRPVSTLTPRRRFTPAEAKIISEWYGLVPVGEIAKKLGRHPSSVRNYGEKIGIRPNDNRRHVIAKLLLRIKELEANAAVTTAAQTGVSEVLLAQARGMIGVKEACHALGLKDHRHLTRLAVERSMIGIDLVAKYYQKQHEATTGPGARAAT
jgi:DNA-binding CsgD family transcriptional regulator